LAAGGRFVKEPGVTFDIFSIFGIHLIGKVGPRFFRNYRIYSKGRAIP